jgi:hypothetical protein
MEHRERFPRWREDVEGIFAWVYRALGNHDWDKYGVTVVNEQTAYAVPGTSHTARQAAAELRFAELTGNAELEAQAIRRLAWTTYMIDHDGKNRYPQDDVWFSDGYTDFIRHYVNAMAAAPELAPDDGDHLLRSSSVVQHVRYERGQISYATWDTEATECLRVTRKPREVVAGKGGAMVLAPLPSLGTAAGWTWQPLAKGGVVCVRHVGAKQVVIRN